MVWKLLRPAKSAVVACLIWGGAGGGGGGGGGGGLGLQNKPENCTATLRFKIRLNMQKKTEEGANEDKKA